MHAIRQYEFGPADTLRYEEQADLEPPTGQVRIAVEVAGVHLLDTYIRSGASDLPFPRPDLPMTPGREVAGRVDDVGDPEHADWMDRRVVAHLGMASGGYAEQTTVDVSSLHEIPDEMTAEVAVAMIGTGRTAELILERARLEANDVVLVTGAAGGLGSLLLQAAVAESTTTVGAAGGPHKMDIVAGLSPTLAVDYLDPRWDEMVAESVGELSVVLDGAGGEIGARALNLLGEGGRILTFGWSSGDMLSPPPDLLQSRGITASSFDRPDDLRPYETRALARAASGGFQPRFTRFPLAKAAAAHTAMENRKTVGKVVLVA